MVTEIWSIQDCLEKLNQRGITKKIKKGEAIILVPCCLDLIHIPIKLHEDIMNST